MKVKERLIRREDRDLQTYLIDRSTQIVLGAQERLAGLRSDPHYSGDDPTSIWEVRKAETRLRYGLSLLGELLPPDYKEIVVIQRRRDRIAVMETRAWAKGQKA